MSGTIPAGLPSAMRPLATALALALATPAAAVSQHDWIDRAPTPFRIEAVEIGFHPLAAPAGATSGIADALGAAIPAALAQWNAGTGPRLRARITIEGMKWANLGVAVIGGTSDELGGLVELVDPETGARVGRVFVDVWHHQGGLFGMALRGDARAKLARDFAEELARAATGRNKP